MSNHKERQAAFQEVFMTHAWGNRNNAGKSYKRAYSKTAKAKAGMESRRSAPVAAKATPAKKKK